MPSSYPWRPSRLLFLFLSTFLQCTEACVDSSGDFYCSSLWYFWFGVFWFCVGLLVMTICIVNRCNKHKTRVDVELKLPPLPLRSTTEKSDTELSARTTTATESSGY